MDRDSIKMYSEMELKYSEKLGETVRKVRNPAIKVLMEAVSRDSVKHSMIYKAILDLMEHKGPLISEDESEKIIEEIKAHIKAEEEMIKNVDSLLKEGTGDKAIEYLLETVLNDEKIHHAILKGIYNIIVKRHTLKESDIWELLWKDSPFHGTPGG